MTVKPFPTHFWVILDPTEQAHLHELFDKDPHLVDEFELVHKALGKGIAVMQREHHANRDPRNMTRTELGTSASSSGRRSKRSQLPAGHRDVESYLGVPVGEELRQRLEDALSEHPEVDEETFYAAVLDVGLRKLEKDPEAFDPARVKEDLESPLSSELAGRREHRARWLALCRKVARGWR